MQLIALLAILLSEHDASHWEMTCDEWNQARVEILSDENHTQDAKEFLVDFFKTKVSDEQCEVWQIGRK